MIGYSGGELFLDLDYLGFVSHLAETAIVWNVRPGEIKSTDHPLVRLAATCRTVRICEGVLPDLLFRLAEAAGVTLHGIRPPSDVVAPRRVPRWQPPSRIWPGQLFGKVFKHVGDHARELAAYRWELADAIAHPAGREVSLYRIADAVGLIGAWYVAHGHRELARTFLEAAVELNRVAGNRFSEAVALNDLGFVYRRERRVEAAIRQPSKSSPAAGPRPGPVFANVP